MGLPSCPSAGLRGAWNFRLGGGEAGLEGGELEHSLESGGV